MLFANVVARVFSLSGTELVEKGSFWAFWLLLGVLCILGVLALLVIPLCVQGLGFKDVPPAGHALRAKVGGCIIFVTPGICWAPQFLPVKFVVDFVVFTDLSCIC